MSTPLVKVVVAGDGNVGKTSLIRRYTEGKFENSRIMTIGVDFHVHPVQLASGPVRLSIWDMGGQEQFHSLRAGFYRGSRATALVYDVTEPKSLENLTAWREEILQAIPQQKFIVIGNKVDLERDVPTSSAAAFAEGIQADHIETSALTGEGVEIFFQKLALLATEG